MISVASNDEHLRRVFKPSPSGCHFVIKHVYIAALRIYR